MVETPVDSALEHLGDAAQEFLVDLVAGSPLPTPVRKNLFKAMARLCSAAIDVPASYLEGKADERRANTTARIKLVNTTADQISEQMKVDPEYARRAVRQFGQRVLREQVNLDLIAEKSVEELRNRAGSDDTSEEQIDDDWLNAFDTEARMKSTEEMQTYFARVLSGEVVRPGSFSLKTIKILGSLDSRVAKLFQKLCSLCLALRASQDMRVVSLAGNAGETSLAKYGLAFGELNLLNEYGLIISDYNSWKDYQVCIGMRLPLDKEAHRVFRLPFVHQGRSWVLVPGPNRAPTTQFRLHGVALTRAAAELAKIVTNLPTPDYTKDLTEFFRKGGLEMAEVDGASFGAATSATRET